MAKRQIIRLTENDLHHIIKESVYQILKENPSNEGLGSWAKGAALGGAMALSPLNGHAQTASNDSIYNDSIENVMSPSMEIEDIVHIIEQNTDSNYNEIHEAEQISMEEGDLADELINACFMDEYDNLKTLDSRDIRELDEEDYYQLEQEIKKGKTLVTITLYDGQKRIPNCIIDLETIRKILAKYDEYAMSEYN